jgi:hypothetical protein
MSFQFSLPARRWANSAPWLPYSRSMVITLTMEGSPAKCLPDLPVA